MQDVKQVIEESGVKKKHLARQLGITPMYLSYMLNGKRDFLDKYKTAILQLLKK